MISLIQTAVLAAAILPSASLAASNCENFISAVTASKSLATGQEAAKRLLKFGFDKFSTQHWYQESVLNPMITSKNPINPFTFAHQVAPNSHFLLQLQEAFQPIVQNLTQKQWVELQAYANGLIKIQQLSSENKIKAAAETSQVFGFNRSEVLHLKASIAEEGILFVAGQFLVAAAHDRKSGSHTEELHILHRETGKLAQTVILPNSVDLNRERGGPSYIEHNGTLFLLFRDYLISGVISDATKFTAKLTTFLNVTRDINTGALNNSRFVVLNGEVYLLADREPFPFRTYSKRLFKLDTESATFDEVELPTKPHCDADLYLHHDDRIVFICLRSISNQILTYSLLVNNNNSRNNHLVAEYQLQQTTSIHGLANAVTSSKLKLSLNLRHVGTSQNHEWFSLSHKKKFEGEQLDMYLFAVSKVDQTITQLPFKEVRKPNDRYTSELRQRNISPSNQKYLVIDSLGIDSYPITTAVVQEPELGNTNSRLEHYKQFPDVVQTRNGFYDVRLEKQNIPDIPKHNQSTDLYARRIPSLDIFEFQPFAQNLKATYAEESRVTPTGHFNMLFIDPQTGLTVIEQRLQGRTEVSFYTLFQDNHQMGSR